jgi:hypothetical protein
VYAPIERAGRKKLARYSAAAAFTEPAHAI